MIQILTAKGQSLLTASAYNVLLAQFRQYGPKDFLPFDMPTDYLTKIGEKPQAF